MHEALLDRPPQEPAQHLFGHLEVADHAVAERTGRADRRRRAADHPLRVLADGQHLPRPLVERDHGRLEQHDPLPAHVDDRVGGAKIDGHIASAPAQVAEQTHNKQTA